MPVLDRWARRIMATMIMASAMQAVAAGPMQWQQRANDGGIVLAYEEPDTGNQGLVLACRPGAATMSMRYAQDTQRSRNGQRVEVELASEGGRSTLSLRAEQQELDDQMVLVGEIALTQAVAGIFQGGTLRITQAGQTEWIPLAGARQGISALVRTCGAR